MAGFVGRGLKNANVPLWTGFFLGYGGQFFDASGKLAVATALGLTQVSVLRDDDGSGKGLGVYAIDLSR